MTWTLTYRLNGRKITRKFASYLVMMAFTQTDGLEIVDFG